MCFDQGANLQTQAWMVKRLLSTFNRAARRPHRPRSWVLRRLMHAAGIPVPPSPVRDSRRGSHDGDEGDGSTDESSNDDNDDDDADGSSVTTTEPEDANDENGSDAEPAEGFGLEPNHDMKESNGPHRAKTEVSPSDPGSLKGNATGSGSVCSPRAVLTSPREREEAPSSSASSRGNSNWLIRSFLFWYTSSRFWM